jgi:hypothetical protein
MHDHEITLRNHDAFAYAEDVRSMDRMAKQKVETGGNQGTDLRETRDILVISRVMPNECSTPATIEIIH